ncbi:hypothetical protein WR25_23003 isoform B [Diploscapter pachys]|uniref:Uncharacterized protein n=1 Tax=Diploscapter pachys TaxID=2018661 RepID=A0A2A2L1R3_9BILA|nr:hypothetical protein WR25_23003 isoform B [Diploscapter pachys]
MSAARFRAYSRSLASYSSVGSARSSYASSYGSYASSYATPSSYSSSYQPRSHSRYKRHKKPTDTKTMVMSEYLGWNNRRPAAGSRDKFDREIIAAGPVTQNYENYVKNIFNPYNRLGTKDKDQIARDHGFSASTMLRMERQLGKHALDDSYDESHYFTKTPLEGIYEEIGLKTNQNSVYRHFPVYKPKSSSEYFAASYEVEREKRRKQEEKELEEMMGRKGEDSDDEGYAESKETRNPRISGYNTISYNTYNTYGGGSFNSGPDYNAHQYKGSYSSYKDRADEEYEKNNRKMLIDYQRFDSSPLSPYLYQSHPYIRTQDSRIVGSNFVQVTSRPKDRFLEKIDQTLAAIRAEPRYI